VFDSKILLTQLQAPHCDRLPSKQLARLQQQPFNSTRVRLINARNRYPFPLIQPRSGTTKCQLPAEFFLSALASDAAGQLNVLGHDGHALGVDGAQVGVLEQTHQVGLGGLLQGQQGGALEAQVALRYIVGHREATCQ
jgi:hypothetical protein